jgi:Tol biopolymer transport system component
MKRTIIAFATLLAFALTLVAQRTASPEAQLGAIISQAEVEGNYEAAIPLYKKFIAENARNKALAARAQYQLAVAYEKLGSAEARKVYEQIVRDYKGQSIAKDADRRLALLRASMNEPAERRICVDCGGSISADGRMLAFGIRRPGENRVSPAAGLAVRDIPSGQVVQLLSGPVLFPVISPDGKRIAYTGSSDTEANVFDLRVIDNRMGAKPRVFYTNPEWMAVHPSAWSPDGKRVLTVVQKRVDRTWMVVWVSPSDGSVEQIKSLARFRAIDSPSVSPDGRYIAYAAAWADDSPPGQVRASSDMHIYVFPVNDPTAEIELVKGASTNIGPVWMPDSKSLLFVSDRSGDFGLWSVELLDGTLKQHRTSTGELYSVGISNSGTYFYTRPVDTQPSLASNLARSFSISELQGNDSSAETFVGIWPEWSPDGKFVAYKRQTPNHPQQYRFPGLFVYSIDSKQEKRYLPPESLERLADDVELTWLHNGKGLLLSIYSEGFQSMRLYRVDLATSEFRLVVPTPNTHPHALSSDDTTLYWVETPFRVDPSCQTGRRIVAVNLNSGEQRPVGTVPLSPPLDPKLSPDNKTLYMRLCGNQRIIAMDVLTGQQRDIFAVQSPNALGRFNLSPDGRTLAVAISNSSDKSVRLARVRVDGTDYRELYTLPTGSLNPLAWTSDGTAVLLYTGARLMRVPADGGSPEDLWTSDGTPVLSTYPAAKVSPDALRIIAPTQRNFSQELWALSNVWSLSNSAR